MGPGEAAEPRPAPDERARERYDPGRQPARDYPREPATTDAGMLSLRVQPEDAIVLVDGEEWDRPAGESRFMIELPEGPHRVEVRKEGYRTYSRTIEVRRGQTLTLNVSLTSGGGGMLVASRRLTAR